RRYVARAEVEGESRPVGCVGDRTAGEERLRLRGEEEAVGRRGVAERLLAEAVARQDQATAASVPQRQAEHPVEEIDEVEPVLLVEVRQHLGIAPGSEAVPPSFERGAKRSAVVDLAVAHRDDVARLVAERLGAARDVDDGEPPAAEGGLAADRGTIAVRSAV